MQRIVTQSTVNGDGTLVVPLGPALAGKHVQVTVEPAAPDVKKAADMTQEEWLAFIAATAGSIPDPTFFRHDQGEHQERDSL